MKRFEAYMPGEGWKAWTASDTVKLTKVRNRVIVVSKVTEPEKKPYNMTTTFNLDNLAGYSIA